MTHIEEIFLSALRCGIHGEPWSSESDIEQNRWDELMKLAQEQDVLPLFFDTVCTAKAFRSLDEEFRKLYQERSLQQVTRQITQAKEFLSLLLKLQEHGIDPIVIKGIIVRELYPQGYLRPSIDEDILIPKEQATLARDVLLNLGLYADQPNDDPLKADELSYHKEDSPTYIEMHMRLFASDSEAYGDCNRYFDEVFSRSVSTPIEDVMVRTLHPTDHLLYLILHAYKHFLHSGVGIRQVCDIALFVEKNSQDIDWKYIEKCCQEQQIDVFTEALFRISEKYLGFAVPDIWKDSRVNELPLMEDMLSGGLYGTNDINRVHSSTITLEAVAAYKAGRSERSRRAFLLPSRKSLQGRYPFLKDKPWLLPIAWIQRLIGYAKENRKDKSLHPSESIRIANKRVQLLRKYRIIR